MKLYGSNLSSFTRRCTIAMTLAEMDFELVSKMTGPDEEELRQHNPLGRLPFLMLDDGTTLIDSSVINRFIDQQTNAFRPADQATDLQCEQTMAIANGVCEKSMSAFYERTRRPEEFCWQGWIDRANWQMDHGLEHLNTLYADAAPYLYENRLTHADIYTYVAAGFVRKTNPDQIPAGKYANLEALEAHLNALHPVFDSTRP